MAKFTVEWLSQSYYSAKEEEPVQKVSEEFMKEPSSQFTPVSPNNSCGYTSASDSSDMGEDIEGEAGRRVRTKFSSEQIRKLEGAFSKQRYLGASQRKKIAEKLGLSETQVKTWFQNRRMKLKREVQDMRTEFLPIPAALMPPMMFQHHALSGQLPAASRRVYPLQEAHRPATHPAMPRHHQHYHPYTTFTHQMIPSLY
ncbi:ventral expressed homeobox [Eucyclogobius newberryi]|uniref:ventral expressed homeobox n=1 Tax=Eucyclogobius newberryi TaxID=166745 RepID=UPI003B5AF26B